MLEGVLEGFAAGDPRPRLASLSKVQLEWSKESYASRFRKVVSIIAKKH